MIGKLVKTESTYHLVVNDKIIASVGDSDGKLKKLSIKNCLSVENGYDLDELVKEEHKYNPRSINEMSFRLGFEVGFQKALEILGDKKFSEKDMIKMIFKGRASLYKQLFTVQEAKSVVLSLQQNEWEVEIEMEDLPYPKELSESEVRGFEEHSPKSKKPKLDADGCLILKRI